jgi:integrase
MVGAIVAGWRKNLRPSSAYLYRGKLNEALRMLETFGAPHLRAPKLPRPSNRATVATGNELARLLTAAQPHLRLFILLYLQCGLRFSETIAVTPRTWDRENHTVTIPVKGGRIRTAQVTPDAEILFASAINPDPDESFITALRGKRMTPSALRMMWNKLRKRCGVNPDLQAHDLRRTAATILYNTTKDLRIAQQLLGHKSLASTLSYLAPLAPDEARRYAELLRFDNFHTEVKQ